MTLPVRAATRAHRALRLAGLLVVLAGLFGMHGLSGQSSGFGSGLSGGHGAAGMSMRTVASASSAARSSMSMDDSDLSEFPAGIVSDAGPSAGQQAGDLLDAATGTGPATDSGGMAMGTMCLAILGAALLALLRFLHRARVAPVVSSLPRRPHRAIIPRGRDPDPPSLTKLSMQRC